jgi:Domain of unknown function (DUF4349)
MSASETFSAELVRELRAVPIAASPALRERVRALGEPTPRSARLPRVPPRRTLLVVAPVCALALIAAAVVHGVLSSSGSKRPEAVAAQPALGSHAGAKAAPPSAATRDQALTPGTFGQSLPAPSPTRHQNYQADLRVRVHDGDALGRQSAAAMRITTELGGYVASVQQTSVKGAPGEADLVLRVPVAKVQEAMIRLSALGTVLDQHISIVDLERAVQQQRDRVRALRVQIAKIVAALQQPLPADVRLRLQFQLDDARRALTRATGAQKATLREAALSRVALTLTTEHAVATTKHDEGRFANAAESAGEFLAGAGAVALLVLIVVSPLLALALLWWYGLRVWRRREERRLLAET